MQEAFDTLTIEFIFKVVASNIVIAVVGMSAIGILVGIYYVVEWLQSRG